MCCGNLPEAPRRILIVLLAALVWPAASACEHRDMEAVGEAETPFVWMLSPAYAAPSEDLDRLGVLLGEASGMAVEIRLAESEDMAVSSAGTYQFDAWLLPLFDYLFCHQEYGSQAGLQVLRHGDARIYRGEILVRADSDIQTVDDLAGKRVAFVDRYSTSGFLYPAKILHEAGVSVESEFAGSHDAALEALRSGRVDAAAIYAGAGEGDPSLRVIATTAGIPNEPVFFREALGTEKRQAFTDALMSVAATPDGGRILGEMADITGFLPVTDAYYDDVKAAIDAAQRNVQDLVPRGWEIHNENQRTLDQYAP